MVPDAGVWTFGWDALVAIGTIGLALVTGYLAWQTRGSVREIRNEAAAIGRQVGLEREQLVAMHRPLVYPHASTAWVNKLALGVPNPDILLRNTGSGPAYNIEGGLCWRDGPGGPSPLTPLALGAGEEAYASVLGQGIEVNWDAAVGYVKYRDLSDIEWQTHFRYHVDGDGNRSVRVVHVGTTQELGEPEYHPDGWANAPPGVKI